MIRRELTNWTLSGPVKSVFPAHVPGDVTDDLHRAGLIEDPLFGENLKKLSWIYDADWTYECLFDADGEILSQKNIYLFFEGIDTFSEILLNGILLGKTDNMFLAYKFPVNGIVKEKGNRLVVRIFSSVGIGKQKNDGKNYRALFNQDRLFLRKAQCQFGWDWAPDLPGIGIWLPAYLLADGGIVIEDLKLTSRTDGTVTFALSLKTDRSLENCSLCICAGERSAEYRAQEFGEYEIKIENYKGETIENNQLVGTGTKIKIIRTTQTNNTTETLAEYTVVLYGDVNGDGKINSVDLLVLQRHILEIQTIEEIFQKAGNINKNGRKPTSVDLLLIQRHILGLQIINQKD